MPGACLIIDDSPLVRETLRRVLLREELCDEVLEAADGAEALELLEGAVAERLELVLCDLVMPGVDGFGFLEEYAARPRLEGIPVIVLTGRDELNAKVAALESGAADYLTKPFEDAELVARVRVHQKTKRLRDELEEANARLRELALRDPLTDLFNRRHWRHVLELELERCRRHGRPLAVAVADVDHFKRVNDRYGHGVGDRVLVAVARAFETEVRAQDSVARLGGEELGVLLPETGLEEAEAVAERLREAVAALSFDGLPELSVRTSLGVAAVAEVGGRSAGALTAAADRALYAAKDAGRDRVVAVEVGTGGPGADPGSDDDLQ